MGSKELGIEDFWASRRAMQATVDLPGWTPPGATNRTCGVAGGVLQGVIELHVSL